MAGTAKPHSKFRYAWVYIGILLTAVMWVWMPPDSRAWQGIAALTILAFLTELLPVDFGKSSLQISITAPINWTAIMLFGPAAAILVAVISFVGASLLGWSFGRMVHTVPCSRGSLGKGLTVLAGPWVERSYPFFWVLNLVSWNSALDVIMVGGAAVVYLLAGGHILAQGYFESTQFSSLIPQLFLPFMAAIAWYFLVDEARYIAPRMNQPDRRQGIRDWHNFVLRCKVLLLENVPSTGRQYLLLPPISFLLAYLYLHVGFWSGLLVFGPFLSFRLSVQKAVEQEQAYMDTIATLGTYMQHYHPYTRGHLKRVAEMSERIALELRLPAETIMLIPYAGLLHDIGKVGVSEEILDKVEKLTDEEWATIKEHPVKGAKIVEHLEFLDRTVDWIKYHHKWADGSGYPENGLKNGGIPVEAMIIAVADAFDAMTDDREMTLDWECDSCGFKPEDGGRPEVCPICGAAKRRTYRQPLSMEQAINELRRGAGSQFKPEVVKAFLRMVDREGLKVGGSG